MYIPLTAWGLTLLALMDSRTGTTLDALSTTHEAATPPPRTVTWADWTECRVLCSHIELLRRCLMEKGCLGNELQPCDSLPATRTGSGDARGNSSRLSPSDYIVLAATIGAFLIVVLVLVVLRSKQVWCFRKKDLWLDVLQTTNVAVYNRRFRVPENSCFQNIHAKKTACSEGNDYAPTSAPVADTNSIEPEQKLDKAANQNEEGDEQHIYEEVSIIGKKEFQSG